MKFPKHDCGLYLTHNEHKDSYESAEEWLSGEGFGELGRAGLFESEEHVKRAIETGEVWQLQWYPVTLVTFYRAAAPTLQELLDYVSRELPS